MGIMNDLEFVIFVAVVGYAFWWGPHIKKSEKKKDDKKGGGK